MPVMCFEKARLPLLAPHGRGRRDDVTRTGVDVLDGDLEAVERASLRAGSEEREGRRSVARRIRARRRPGKAHALPAPRKDVRGF